MLKPIYLKLIVAVLGGAAAYGLSYIIPPFFYHLGAAGVAAGFAWKLAPWEIQRVIDTAANITK